MSAATSVLPLQGRCVVVTRARNQAEQLSARLTALGAHVIEIPAIEIVAAPPELLDAAISRLNEYDWLLFTSVNAVDLFFERVISAAGSADIPSQVGIGAIGVATAERVRAFGAAVSFVPREFVAEAMVEGLVARGIRGKRVLLPRARIARATLPDGLRAAGADVDVVTIYDTRRPDSIDEDAIELLRSGQVDLVTFASPSTVRNIADLIEDVPSLEVPVACIGPITAAAAWECGFRVMVQAREYSIPGLVQAVVECLANTSKERQHL